MPYSSDDDLLIEFTESELAKLSGDTTGEEINTTRTNYARANADSLIDAYLHGRYDVPFEGDTDPLIKKLSIDLTIANLFEYSYQRSLIPQGIINRKLDAIKMLKDIQLGRVILFGSDAGTNAPPPIISNKTANDKLFTDGLLNQFIGE